MKHHVDFAELLRKSGFKATPGRIVLLKMLAKHTRPLSLIAIGKELDGKLDQATVYRALEAFVEKGMVKRVDLGHAHTHYELAEGRAHHHHLVCKTCGTVEDVSVCVAEPVEKSVLKKSKSFSSVDDHSLEFFGTCKDCTYN